MRRMHRREFLQRTLRATAACATAAGLSPRGVHGERSGPAATLPALTDRPSTLHIDPSLKSIVADVRAREVVVDGKVHETLLGEMLDEAIRLATGAKSAAEGWNKLIRPDEVIAIKFNQIGQEVIGTTVPFGSELIRSLQRAGFAPDRMILVEAPDRLTREFKTRPCPIGFSGPKVSFGSGEDELAAVLQEAGAIINVPFLKTHNLARMTCCLKNLSHALVRQPKLCHADACRPFVGDILSLPQVKPKLRVHVVNALRAVFDGGPLPTRDNLWTHSGILVSTDPVAADFVATEILDEQRLQRGLPAVGDRDGYVPHVHAAADRGLGTDDQDYISVLRPALF
ncbi:MAG TPA: DUF362 domain-containing protein [Phycisphaerae bacterium]|nr:DUF362 domain-containing protein [Phycisphaerae bacterium]HOJ74004.1 DUF362 domain-containing protein [Phycisphaerae bacterium]HOM50599.1 DUF362 domain-containing protein [Phycisphaerae bacterium]HOQ87097.1 DUF362 domain-containing protein [Phycisphaerae bacterium]HPP26217.1 DUF362 domain-containing protein [Phycisphaerae bacterium]